MIKSNQSIIAQIDRVWRRGDGDDAFVTCNGWTTDGKLFLNTERFTFKDGKIKAYERFFGTGVTSLTIQKNKNVAFSKNNTTFIISYTCTVVTFYFSKITVPFRWIRLPL